MIFSSPRFLAFLVVLLALLGLPLRLRTKLHVLAAASCLFYAAWDVRYLVLLVGVSAVDYWAAAQIHKSEVRRTRQAWLALSVVSNLTLLGYFKYTNFFIENLNGVLGRFGGHVTALHILLPAGISFYTFKTMSYTIDVYRKEIQPCRSWLDYVTFVTFFPELIAGPIVRANVFLPQMQREIGPTRERLSLGISIFLFGLMKKLVIADPIASAIDPVFADVGAYSGASLWLAALGYSIQIYCDFSGYSDMAIGVAKMIGYDLPENFAMPYLSGDITEFWRRWHITLSSWLRDYLYIPLGGNRRGLGRTYLNLAATMMLGGLWHGASWNFVVWGALHGCALAIHRWLTSRADRRSFPNLLTGPLTFVFVTLAWIPFRCTSFEATFTMVNRMFTLQPGFLWFPLPVLIGTVLLVVAHFIGHHVEANPTTGGVLGSAVSKIDGHLHRDDISSWFVHLRLGSTASIYAALLWLLTIFFFAATGASPFIYFQF
ncbi:MAG: MBOAT family protein [Myxococcaceae bacterium]